MNWWQRRTDTIESSGKSRVRCLRESSKKKEKRKEKRKSMSRNCSKELPLGEGHRNLQQVLTQAGGDLSMKMEMKSIRKTLVVISHLLLVKTQPQQTNKATIDNIVKANNSDE